MPFGVPLRTQHKAGSGQRDRFDLAVRRRGFDSQTRGQPVDALMVQGIDLDFAHFFIAAIRRRPSSRASMPPGAMATGWAGAILHLQRRVCGSR